MLFSEKRIKCIHWFATLLNNSAIPIALKNNYDGYSKIGTALSAVEVLGK
jgi:hypothetical protein